MTEVEFIDSNIMILKEINVMTFSIKAISMPDW